MSSWEVASIIITIDGCLFIHCWWRKCNTNFAAQVQIPFQSTHGKETDWHTRAYRIFQHRFKIQILTRFGM